MEVDFGDFCDRCLPKTYKYFKSKGLMKEYQNKCKDMDCFDFYIQEKVPFFNYLMSNYYKLRKLISLQLMNFTEKKLMEHLDELVCSYITTSDQSYYDEAKELYYYILESYIVYLVDKK